MAQKLDFEGVCMVSVSGGSDSDIMIDLIEKSEKRCKIVYAFYDTGIEYQATKDHLSYLEKRYGITINRVKAVVPVPIAVKHYGYPFLSKNVSNYIGRLQKHKFHFSNTSSFEEDLAVYPKMKVGLRFWHDMWGEKSRFNISNYKSLKEFLANNSQSLARISDGCCQGAKKRTAKKAEALYKPELTVIGVRRAQAGARATAYSNCFTPAKGADPAEYRPLFFWTDEDKDAYEKSFNVVHSKCYTEYGLKRTGCAGCPFSSRWEEELKICERNEPKLYAALLNVFGPAYDIAKRYRRFKEAANR